jgi:hypothetical protein
VLDPQSEKVWHSLCEKYGRPLEQEHRGEFVAISPTGDVLLSSTFGDAVKKSEITSTKSVSDQSAQPYG